MNNNMKLILIATALYTTTINFSIFAIQFYFKDKVSDFEIAFLSSVFWFVAFFASPLWGIISDLFRTRKKVLTLTLLFGGVAYALHYYHNDYQLIVAWRLLAGLFLSAFLPVTIAYITEGSKKTEVGKVTARFNTARSLGFFLSGFLITFILYFLDALSLFLLGSIALLIASLLIFFTREEQKNFLKEEKKLEQSLKKQLSTLIPRKDFIRKNNAVLLVIALGLRHVGIMGMFSLIFVYLSTRGDMPTEWLSAYSSINTLLQIITMNYFGNLADKIGRKKVFVPGFFLSALVPLIFLFPPNAVTTLLAFSVLGISFSAMISGITPFLKDIAPPGKEAESLSFLNVGRAIGFIIGPIIAGLIAQYFGYTIMFIAQGVIVLFATLLSMKAIETLNNSNKLVEDKFNVA